MGLHDDNPLPENLPDPDGDPAEWLKVSLMLLAKEVECCQHHFKSMESAASDESEQQTELGCIMMHFANLGREINVTSAFVKDKMISEDALREVMRELLQEEIGMVVDVVEVEILGQKVKVFSPQHFAVPDDLAGLVGDDKSENRGDGAEPK